MSSSDWLEVPVTELQASTRWALNGGPFGSKLVTRDYVEAGVPVIRGANLPSDKRFSFDDFVFVSAEKADELIANNARPGDVVFTQRGTLGQVGIIPKASPYPRFVISQSQMKITVDEDRVDPYWLFYCFRDPNIQQEMINRASTSGVPHINLGVLREFRVRLPPLPIQRRIASILSAYDDLIENNTRRIAILEEMARRIYEEWFVHFRFPGHESVQIVESELGLVPEGWSIRSLESLCLRITDGSHFSPASVHSGKPMASVKDMGDWCINLSTCRLISDSDYKALVRNGCNPIAGDILIAKDGNTNLKYMLVIDEEPEFVLLSSVAILRPHDQNISDLLCTYLKLPYVKDRLRGFVSGAAIPRVILKDFRRFLVPMPPQHLCAKWTTQCGPMVKLCRILTRKNNRLREMRDLLLPKLISGEIDVSKLPEPEAVAA